MTSNRPTGVRGFTILWLGQILSLLGSAMTWFAFTLWAWKTTGSATVLSTVSFFAFLPSVLLAPIAGTFVDRWNRKLVMILSDAATATGTLIALVLPLLALQMLLTLGVTGLTSAAHVNYRDIGHALPLFTQLWMFATPVAYPIRVIPEWLRPLYMLNPMAPIIDGYRRAFLLGQPPDLSALTVSAGITVALTALALAVFKRAELTFADVI